MAQRRLRHASPAAEVRNNVSRTLNKADCDFCTHAKEGLKHLRGEYGFSLAPLDMLSPEGETLALVSRDSFLTRHAAR